jgi:hypothetical protein
MYGLLYVQTTHMDPYSTYQIIYKTELIHNLLLVAITYVETYTTSRT